MLSYKLKTPVVFALMVMMSGSLIAATNDLAFDLYAYLALIGNDLFTALTGVFAKIKLNKSNPKRSTNDEEKEAFLEADKQKPPEKEVIALGTWGLLFYNSIFAAPTLLFLLIIGQPQQFVIVHNYEHWNDWRFVVMFSISTVMGTVIQFSVMYCTKVNSALTTSVTGTLKNMITTYLGMIAPGLDYVYSFYNFVGVNVSLAGGVYYAWYKFQEKTSKTTNT